MPCAFITGITGQDGSYLAELLLTKGYEVHGFTRSLAGAETAPNLANVRGRITLHAGNLQDSATLVELLRRIKPHELYHFAAQPHIPQSWDDPVDTLRANVIGVAALLEAARRGDSWLKRMPLLAWRS